MNVNDNLTSRYIPPHLRKHSTLNSQNKNIFEDIFRNLHSGIKMYNPNIKKINSNTFDNFLNELEIEISNSKNYRNRLQTFRNKVRKKYDVNNKIIIRILNEIEDTLDDIIQYTKNLENIRKNNGNSQNIQNNINIQNTSNIEKALNLLHNIVEKWIDKFEETKTDLHNGLKGDTAKYWRSQCEKKVDMTLNGVDGCVDMKWREYKKNMLELCDMHIESIKKHLKLQNRQLNYLFNSRNVEIQKDILKYLELLELKPVRHIASIYLMSDLMNIYHKDMFYPMFEIFLEENENISKISRNNSNSAKNIFNNVEYKKHLIYITVFTDFYSSGGVSKEYRDIGLPALGTKLYKGGEYGLKEGDYIEVKKFTKKEIGEIKITRSHRSSATIPDNNFGLILDDESIKTSEQFLFITDKLLDVVRNSSKTFSNERSFRIGYFRDTLCDIAKELEVDLSKKHKNIQNIFEGDTNFKYFLPTQKEKNNKSLLWVSPNSKTERCGEIQNFDLEYVSPIFENDNGINGTMKLLNLENISMYDIKDTSSFSFLFKKSKNNNTKNRENNYLKASEILNKFVGSEIINPFNINENKKLFEKMNMDKPLQYFGNDIIPVEKRIINGIYMILWSYIDRINNTIYEFSLLPDNSEKILVLSTLDILKKEKIARCSFFYDVDPFFFKWVYSKYKNRNSAFTKKIKKLLTNKSLAYNYPNNMRIIEIYLNNLKKTLFKIMYIFPYKKNINNFEIQLLKYVNFHVKNEFYISFINDYMLYSTINMLIGVNRHLLYIYKNNNNNSLVILDRNLYFIDPRTLFPAYTVTYREVITALTHSKYINPLSFHVDVNYLNNNDLCKVLVSSLDNDKHIYDIYGKTLKKIEIYNDFLTGGLYFK
jgi:hypothetical protein